MIYRTSLDAICSAPVLRLQKLFPNHSVWLKTDAIYMTKGIKSNISDRIAAYLFDNATRKSDLYGKTIIIAPLNKTCIGFAKIGAIKNFQVLFIAPYNLAKQHIDTVRHYGADVIYSPSHLGMEGAYNATKKLASQNSEMWFPTLNNKYIYIKTLIQEINLDFPNGLDYLVIPSISEKSADVFAYYYKRMYPHSKVFIATTTADLTCNSVLNKYSHSLKTSKTNPTRYLDGIITISKEHSLYISNLLPLKEGMPAHFTSGGALHAVEKLVRHYSLSFAYNILTFHIGI